MEIIELVIMIAMVILNGVFAGYEIALAAVTVPRLQILVRENRIGAKAALYMKQNMEASLTAVQLAITLLAASAAAIGGLSAAESIRPFLHQTVGLSSAMAAVLSIVTVVIPLTLFTMMFGELLPKVFSIRNKEWVSLKLSPMMRWFCFSVWPIIWCFEASLQGLMQWSERLWRPRVESSQKREATELLELRAHAVYARASRLIGERQENIILGASRLSNQTVREIMLPADHITMLSIDASLEQSLITAHLEMHTRFPVAEGTNDPQSILGYVNFKDLVALMRLSLPHNASLRSILRPIPSIGANLTLTACLERMIHEHTHIALVRDKASRVVGLVTLEDILEEFVGDIQDEYDRLPTHITPSGQAWVVGGGLPLSRLKEMAAIELMTDSQANETAASPRNVSDWIILQLKRAPRGGDIIETAGLRVIVRKVRRQKVLEAQVGRND